MEQQTENQRLKFLMKELGFTSQKKFADKLEIGQSSLSGIIKEKSKLGVSNAIKFKLSQLFGVNRAWLTTGVGEPFVKEEVNPDERGVPYYNIDIADADLGSLLVMEEKPEYFVNYRPFNDCSAYFPVFGDSMYPRYASGEIIAVKEIRNLEVIQWGEAYVVLTSETSNGLRSIKTLHEHNDPQKLILKSTNPNFRGDTVIKKSDILSLYIIKGKITRNMI